MIPVPLNELEELYQQIKAINTRTGATDGSLKIQRALKELLAYRHEERRKSEQRS